MDLIKTIKPNEEIYIMIKNYFLLFLYLSYYHKFIFCRSSMTTLAKVKSDYDKAVTIIKSAKKYEKKGKIEKANKRYEKA